MTNLIQETLSDEQWSIEMNKIHNDINEDFKKLVFLFDKIDKLEAQINEDERNYND